MKFSDLISYVLPEVPGANVIAIERALLDGAREFCQRTFAWEHEATVTIRRGRTSAALSYKIPTQSAVCGMLGWESDDTSYAPGLRKGNTEIFIDEAQTADIAYALTLALCPSRSADEVPDWLDAEYRDAIAAYAKHELMLIPEKVWTNPGRAAVLYQIFTDAVNDAKRNRNVTRLRGKVRMRVPGVR